MGDAGLEFGERPFRSVAHGGLGFTVSGSFAGQFYGGESVWWHYLDRGYELERLRLRFFGRL